MGGTETPLTESEIRKQAYLMGMRLKNSGLDGEIIYARLERHGFPEALAHEVVKDILLQRKRDVVEETTPFYNIALIRAGLGVVAGLVSYAIFPEYPVIPVGMIAGGLFAAFQAKKKMEK